MELSARIVVDTGPLIALSAVGRLDLLPTLFRPVVPEAVIRELEAGERDSGTSEMLAVLRRSVEWAEAVAVEPLLAAELGPGEAAVIQTARNLGIDLVLIDGAEGPPARTPRVWSANDRYRTPFGGGKAPRRRSGDRTPARRDEGRRLLDCR